VNTRRLIAPFRAFGSTLAGKGRGADSSFETLNDQHAEHHITFLLQIQL
jgi:hypothetical protein